MGKAVKPRPSNVLAIVLVDTVHSSSSHYTAAGPGVSARRHSKFGSWPQSLRGLASVTGIMVNIISALAISIHCTSFRQ